jgi:monooxygenase
MEVRSISWSSETSTWTLTAFHTKTKANVVYTCRFIFLCTGYYDYQQGYTPTFPNQDLFKGKIIHPQFWPENFDYSKKRITVIGSGATAVTLVPVLAQEAAHVTMLQRSPTYILPLPDVDHLSNFIMAILPSSLGHWVNRWKNIMAMNLMFYLCQSFPSTMKWILLSIAKSFLGPNISIPVHFTPSYKPWDERLCIVPDGDLFTSLRDGKSSVKTGEIHTFTPNGIQYYNREKNGAIEEIPSDIIVTATGLVIKLGGGIAMSVDGNPITTLSDRYMYKGVMVSGLPNLVMAVGYTNQSFTLKVDLISKYISRVWKYMDQKGYTSFTPLYKKKEGEGEGEPLLGLSSGYIKRAIDTWPKQGRKSPWKYYQNYLYDIWEFYSGRVNDGVMVYK